VGVRGMGYLLSGLLLRDYRAIDPIIAQCRHAGAGADGIQSLR